MANQMNDIALTEGSQLDDMQTNNGDFIIVESTAEHQRQLLLNDKGEFKENPTTCVGVYNYLDDEGLQELSRDVTVVYAEDGMTVNSVQLAPDGTLDIDANY
jgi:hypothetical protein